MNKFHYNQKRRKNNFFVVTVILLMLLIFATHKNREVMTLGGNALGSVTGPVTKGISLVTHKSMELAKSIFGTRTLRREHRELKEENEALKSQIAKLEEVVHKSEFLEHEYQLLTQANKKLLKSYVIAKEPGNLFIRFDIDKGSVSGVKVNDVVVMGTGLPGQEVAETVVGRVTEVGLSFSKVSALVDENNSISFTLNRNGEQGVIRGRADQGLEGYMFNNDAEVKVGDRLYTSGLGGIYPRDLYIGEVTAVEVSDNDLIKRVMVKSPINYSKLFRVMVLQKEEDHE